MQLYANRQQAGQVLAQLLQNQSFEHTLLLALPRGGVPVALEISQELNLPLDVIIVRKIGHPLHREYGIGAMVEDEKVYLTDKINYADPRVLEVINEERKELRRRISEYRYGQHLKGFEGKDVLLVDDGIATGVTATAAAKFLKDNGAHRVTLAVPVAPPEDSEQLLRFVDEVICPMRPDSFSAVGEWYEDFSEVSDEEVLEMLRSRAGQLRRMEVFVPSPPPSPKPEDFKYSVDQ